MGRTTPSRPEELRRILVQRLGLAATIIGMVAGSGFYWLEADRFEKIARDHALSGARHFEAPAMQALLGAGEEHHGELAALLDQARFAGVRVYRPDSSLAFEAWATLPAQLIAAAQRQERKWPAMGRHQFLRIDTDGERLILTMLPLAARDGSLVGYLESATRIDGETLQTQRAHTRIAAMSSVASVALTSLLVYPLMLAMLRKSTELSRSLLDSNLSLLRSLGNAVAKRDSQTDAHNYRVTLYAVALAEELRLPRNEIATLVTGAFLHDVGKIGIPDRILLKPDKLTNAEWEVMKTHVALGLEIVADNRWLEGAALTIAQHHERFDGTGYPGGLRETEISRVARVFAVVDVFDALTSERPYRSPMPFPEALAEIEQESGRHFDPKAVAAMRIVAPAMFGKVSAANIATLDSMLRDALARYFDAALAA